MSIVEEMGDTLARDVIAALDELGDDRFYDKVGKILGDASPTLQESFMTAIRVRLADIRARVQVRYPQGTAAFDVQLADLMGLVHARDAAESKVASIGTVNPRPAGFVNNLVQRWKRFISRVLDWHVREQVEFNRGTINCVNAVIESLNDLNRAVKDLAERSAAEQAELRNDLIDVQRALGRR